MNDDNDPILVGLELELLANALVLARYHREGRGMFDLLAGLENLAVAAQRYEAQRNTHTANDTIPQLEAPCHDNHDRD